MSTIDPDDEIEVDDGRRRMTEEEMAALPDDPSEIFDPAGYVDSGGVKGDALLPAKGGDS
jgi:hypothetical protein